MKKLRNASFGRCYFKYIIFHQSKNCNDITIISDEIIKFEIPDWYKTIGKELMHRETEVHTNICEMAKTAASINKKENLDNINAAYTGEVTFD